LLAASIFAVPMKLTPVSRGCATMFRDASLIGLID
jgi:hypothetical protein